MCRPAHEGGRRCPGNRGERRRAYQRSRYAAAQSEKEREASTNQATDEDQSPPQEQEEQSEQVEERTTPPPRHRDDVAAMTPEQRAEVLEELREEIAVTRQQVQEQMKQFIISDTKRTQEMYIEALEHRGEDTSKFVMNPETVGYFSYSLWNPSVDPSLISEYESKVRELGAAVESATLITEYETYEKYGLNSSEMTAEDIKRLVHDYGLMDIHLQRHETYMRNTTERDIYQDPIFTKGNITPESFSKYVAKLAYLDEYRARTTIERMVPRFLEEHPEVEDAYNSPEFHREVIERIGELYTMKDEDYLALLSQGHIEQAQNKIYADAFRQESGQEFSSVITPEKTSISAQPGIIDQFNDACRLYPDTLTENAQKYNNDVHFSLKRGFARGDSYVSKRAYYRKNEDVKVPIKGKATYVMTLYGLQSAGNDTISEMDKKLEKGIWDEETYRGSLNRNYPEVTEENLARVKEFIDKQNAPAGKHETGRYYVTNKRGGFMKVAYTTFTDKYGTERLMITSKNDVTLGHEKKSMTSIVTDGREDTTIHEVAHFMEADPQINMACRRFLERRTEGLESMIYHKADHTNDHQDEIVVEDGFYRSYVGKSYRYSHNTEVFSMGMEGLFSPDEYPSSDRPHGGLKPIPVVSINRKGKDAGSIGIEQVVSHPQVDDPEHRALILGLLSSVQSREELYRQVEREV